MAQPVLIDGSWKTSDSTGEFQPDNPRTATPLPDTFPVSSWSEIDTALNAASAAFEQLRLLPRARIADFLENYADRIEKRSSEISELANLETALPVEPRLASIELPRTTGQLRQAASACRNQTWCMPVIDTQTNIRSCHGAIGPVAVFGPNNFPFAFGSASGGDFAAAIAAGNPVIAKANSMHPGTTRLFAEEALQALQETELPLATVQLIYRTSHEDGERLACDQRLGSIGYTGSRSAGLKLKSAADSVGKPIYLELSSVNPVVILPGALAESGETLVEDLKTSCLMGTGQFCTSPGLIILTAGDHTTKFVETLCEQFKSAPVGTLLSGSGQKGLSAAIEQLESAGAERLCGGGEGGGEGYSHANTVLRVTAEAFLEKPEVLQTEAFGNATVLVIANDQTQIVNVVDHLEGNLTGCIYSATDGSDDSSYDEIAPRLRQRVGRLLNDKMPTGVAVCAAMNHGGPFPATGHPAFTAVGIPGSIVRFSMLQCYDNVRHHRLPEVLQDTNPGGVWRMMDGQWTTADVATTANV